MERGHKLTLGAITVGTILVLATVVGTRQKVQVVQVALPTPIVTVAPTATPAATLNLKSVNGKVVLPTGLTRIGTPAAVTRAVK